MNFGNNHFEKEQQFLDDHLIPNVGLDEADIENFFEERETILINQLTKVLGFSNQW